ncbi:retrovirus-related pol polyprotein from transposon TNT 1-94 [Tanacetum coccineum]
MGLGPGLDGPTASFLKKESWCRNPLTDPKQLPIKVNQGGLTHIADGNHAESVVYNKNFPRLGTNRPNGVGHDKDMTEKPIQVRRNVEIAHEDSNTIWEVETDFASPLKSVWVDEPKTCDKPIGESERETINQHDFVSGMVRMDTKDSGHVDGSDENLRVESGLNIAKSTPSDGFYANLIGAESSQVTNEKRVDMKPKKLNFRSFVNEEKVEDSDIVLPRYAIDMVKSKFENSLVGYFIGKSLAFQIVQNYVTNTWSKFGFQKLMKNDDGIFLFKFADKSKMEQVLEVHAWGRINFARALIEISSDTDFKKEVIMAIPDEDGISYTKEVINVEYEWQPPRCADCKIFGHSSDRCPKIVRDHVAPISKDTKSDGFTEVKRKNHKGKKADIQHKSRHIDGIRLDKQKPNFYWQKKGATRRGADMDSTTKVGANAINKVKGPSTSNSFDALNTMDVTRFRAYSVSIE